MSNAFRNLMGVLLTFTWQSSFLRLRRTVVIGGIVCRKVSYRWASICVWATVVTGLGRLVKVVLSANGLWFDYRLRSVTAFTMTCERRLVWVP